MNLVSDLCESLCSSIDSPANEDQSSWYNKTTGMVNCGYGLIECNEELIQCL